MTTFEIAIVITTLLGSLQAQLNFDPALYHPNGTCKSLVKSLRDAPEEQVSIRSCLDSALFPTNFNSVPRT